MKWLMWSTVLLALGTRATVAQQIIDPTVEVTPERDSATVGDSVPLRIRVRLDDRDLLLDSVPHLVGEMPRGMRILVANHVVRQLDRTFAGRIVVAFYRVGRQTIPPFALPYRRNVSVLGATVRGEPVSLEIVPVLPAGSSQPLQDIKDLEPTTNGNGMPSGLILLALAVLLMLWFRRRRRRDHVPVSPTRESTAPLGALETALEQLRQIAQEQWPERGQVARHYEAVVAVLRDYLAESARIPARVSTTVELVAAVPASFMPNGTRERLRDLLTEADLVKFARVRPAPLDAEQFLNGMRELLTGWKTDAAR